MKNATVHKISISISWIEKKKSENSVTQIFYAQTIFIIPILSFHLKYIDLPKLTEQQIRSSCISYVDGNFNVNVKLGLKVYGKFVLKENLR